MGLITRTYGRPGIIAKKLLNYYKIDFKRTSGGDLNSMYLTGVVGYISTPGTNQEAFLRFSSGANVRYKCVISSEFRATSNGTQVTNVSTEIIDFSKGMLLDDSGPGHTETGICQDMPLMTAGGTVVNSTQTRLRVNVDFNFGTGITICRRVIECQVLIQCDQEPDYINTQGMIDRYDLDFATIEKIE